ncbi:MAG TPA: hypothetical protein DD434_06115, partial [Bacteroidales bacterium]|nr:hypothetical protein [Bacteroidales bacterium]
MKNNIILIQLLLIISIGLQAQTFTEIYRGDYYKIKGITNEGNNTLNVFNNFDEEELFISSYGYPSDTMLYFLINDNLDVVKRYEFNRNFIFPYLCVLNNKIYGLRGDYVWTNYYYIENLWLLMYDSVENVLHKDTIMKYNDDTLKWTELKQWVLKDRNIMLSLESYPKTAADPLEGGSIATKLIKIDTLGNVLKTKIFYHKCL